MPKRKTKQSKPKKLINILVFGKGRMGQLLQKVASEYPEYKLLATLGKKDDPKEFIQNADILIDFSAPEATEMVCSLAEKYKKPLLIGTTGQNEKEFKRILKAAKQVPILKSPNFSPGISLLKTMCMVLSDFFAGDSIWDVEIIEKHHSMKKDAPSGTALELAALLRTILGKGRILFGRQGKAIRQPGDIGIHSIRCGTTLGEHSILFGHEGGEMLEIKHTITDRSVFAYGAFTVIPWLIHQPPGMYTVESMLGGEDLGEITLDDLN